MQYILVIKGRYCWCFIGECICYYLEFMYKKELVTLNKNMLIKILKIIVMAIIVFLVGFIGTIALIIKRSYDMTAAMVNIQEETVQTVKLFGIKVEEFRSIYNNGGYEITIVKNMMYDYLPFIVGFILLIVVIVMTIITKKLITNYNKK